MVMNPLFTLREEKWHFVISKIACFMHKGTRSFKALLMRKHRKISERVLKSTEKVFSKTKGEVLSSRSFARAAAAAISVGRRTRLVETYRESKHDETKPVSLAWSMSRIMSKLNEAGEHFFLFATVAPSFQSEHKLAHEDVALRPLAGTGCNKVKRSFRG